MASNFGWSGEWDAPRRVAGIGGLVLDWVSWQWPKDDRAPAGSLQGLAALVSSEPSGPPLWEEIAPTAHAPRYAIGISCNEAWPLVRGRFVYAVARIRTALHAALAMRLGSYVGYRLWVDGVPVMGAGKGPAFAVDDNRCTLTLAPGGHTLTVEVDRNEWQTVFHVRISTLDGRDPEPGAVAVARVDEGASPRAIAAAFDLYGALMDAPGELSLDAVPLGGWEAWREAFATRYRELLALPQPGAITASVTDRSPWRGLTLERVVLHGGAAGPVPLRCLLPADRDGQRVPAVICIHGHGAGKDDVCGIDYGDAGAAARIATHHYDYGLVLARQGYAVFAPDLRAFGERADPGLARRSRDACDNNLMKALMVGYLPLALDLADLRAVIDYAESRSEVDAARIGCVGLSLGGRMGMYLAALDDRVGATVASGALNLLKERLTSYASCGSQLLPGIWRYGDTPELYGLIAPRPLLLELGTQDGTSPEVYGAEVHRLIRHAYRLAGAEDRLAVDVFARGHRFSGRLVLAFLDRWLRGNAPQVPRIAQ